jgi:thioredoxin 1
MIKFEIKKYYYIYNIDNNNKRMKEIESGDEYREIIKNNRMVVVDMFAEWCGPCKRIQEPMELLEEKYDQVTFVKLDIDQLSFMDIELTEPETIPCLVYIVEGQIVKMLNTSDMKQIEQQVKRITEWF